MYFWVIFKDVLYFPEIPAARQGKVLEEHHEYNRIMLRIFSDAKEESRLLVKHLIGLSSHEASHLVYKYTLLLVRALSSQALPDEAKLGRSGSANPVVRGMNLGLRLGDFPKGESSKPCSPSTEKCCRRSSGTLWKTSVSFSN